MDSESRLTLSKEFELEALTFIADSRSSTVTEVSSLWLEDVIPTLSQREKMRIYNAYDAGYLSEGAAHVLLGDGLYAVEDAIAEMRAAIESTGTAASAGQPTAEHVTP